MKGWLAAGSTVIALFLLLGLLTDAFEPGPQGPPDSAYSTSPDGVAAWAELLAHAGHPAVPLRTPLGSVKLPAATPYRLTLVVLGASSLAAPAGRNLERFVRAGGRLLIGGGDPNAVLPALLTDPPRWTSTGPTQLALAGVLGVRTVLTAGAGSWQGGNPLLQVRQLGRGQIELLADPSPLQNRLLTSADDAQLGLDLAGPGADPVVFAEALHGFGPATGLAAIPTRWWFAFGGLLLAAGAWALARGRRLGTAEQPAPAAVPPRTAYVEALAGALVRTRDPGAVARLAEAALERRRLRGAG